VQRSRLTANLRARDGATRPLARPDGAGGSGPPTVVTDAPVRDIVADNSSGDFYLGGDFLTVSGVARSHVARVNGATGAISPWAPSVAGNVLTLDLGAGGLVMGGNFASVNGTTRNNIASVDLVTGTLLSWDPNASGQVNAVASDGAWIHAGGSFPIMNGVARSNLFAMNLQNQTITPWNPGTNDTVLVLYASNDTIYVGGRFTQLAGTSRNCLGAVHRDTGALYAFNPSVTLPFNNAPYVAAIVKSRNLVYFGGQFTHVGGFQRNNIAAWDATVNVIAPWNPFARATPTTNASMHHAVTSSTAAQVIAMAPTLVLCRLRSVRIRASTGNAVMLIAAPMNSVTEENFIAGASLNRRG